MSVAQVVEHALEASQPGLEAAGHSLEVQLPAQPVLVSGDLFDAGNPPDVGFGNLYDFNITSTWAYAGKLEEQLADRTKAADLAAAELKRKAVERSDLDAKLQAAGILPGHSSANDVLARLKAPAAEPMPMLEAPRLQIEAQPVAVERGEKS